MRAIANNDGSVLMAPERLISSTRGDFRSAALQHIDQLGDAGGSIVIDMTRTVEIDTSGLGMLVFIQKRAKERGFSTILRRAPERVRNLLQLTLLEFLFEFRD
jgi:anti-anti-sigma factor